MNIIIPMAGHGSRFAERGYSFPKPLIEVGDKPMIQVIVENLNIDAKYTFICLEEHLEQYALRELLELIAPGCQIVPLSTVTEGAAATVLLAEEYVDSDEELIIANSDQWINWSSPHFLEYIRETTPDGAILTFYATHPKWSYAKIDENGVVAEVAEKKPISPHATVGIYYYRQAKSFFDGTRQMIEKDIRVNNEFYVCPVFNELIGNGQTIINYPVAEMRGIGTPEDLERFLRVKNIV
jgi:NDP-sugar pyrophosphorylase family protein